MPLSPLALQITIYRGIAIGHEFLAPCSIGTLLGRGEGGETDRKNVRDNFALLFCVRRSRRYQMNRLAAGNARCSLFLSLSDARTPGGMIFTLPRAGTNVEAVHMRRIHRRNPISLARCQRRWPPRRPTRRENIICVRTHVARRESGNILRGRNQG